MPRKRKQITRPSREEQLRATTMYIAMVVRNAMEDFQVKHLSDVQMAESNPIIRNAIYTALYAIEHRDEPGAQGFLQFNEILIPSYWELPKLLRNYSGTLTPPINPAINSQQD